jgi:hypothetical protein
MLKRFLTGVSIVALSMGMSACEKVERPAVDKMLPFEEARMLDAIPLAYGKLVAITPSREFQAGLWFEKPDKTVVLVRVNWATGNLLRDVLTIPRK